MSAYINLDDIWVLNLPRRTEGVLYENGVTSISQLKILARMGSLIRLEGIGPASLAEVVQALELYDDAWAKAIPSQEYATNAGPEAIWEIVIMLHQDEGNLTVLHRREYHLGMPIPRVGEIIWLTGNEGKGYVVESVHHLYSKNEVAVIVKED